MTSTTPAVEGKNSTPANCYCDTGKPFAQCCEPFLTMKEKPKSVRQLVRARYSAYAIGAGKHREFLIRTWHPKTAGNISIVDISNDNFTWRRLELIESDQKGDLGKVEFKATYVEDDGTEHVHHERSMFHRIKGLWLYVQGEVSEE
ncbi:MAG: YchJ family metal-binding protein [Pseudomonadota bacterium]